jgi:formylglycine-generating enzyme required for sulfatase activity
MSGPARAALGVGGLLTVVLAYVLLQHASSTELPSTTAPIDAAVLGASDAGTVADSLVAPDATESRCAGEDCAAVRAVPGAQYRRVYDGAMCAEGRSATVSGFVLDRFETTVGRFRAFVASGGGTRAQPPEVGAGAHPQIAASGWRAEWNEHLAPTTVELTRGLACGPSATWTDAAGATETSPINCVSWYEAFAFCAWDGGRLPTEAEWNLAAAGGEQERERPWSPSAGASIDRSRAVYGEASPFAAGSCSPSGDGRWGHADLVGNLWEWTLDANAGDGLLPRDGASPCALDGLPMPCRDCAGLEGPTRVSRGGGFGMPSIAMRAAIRRADDPASRFPVMGLRCARDVDDVAVVETVSDPSVDVAPNAEGPSLDTLHAGEPFPSFALRGVLGASDALVPMPLDELIERSRGRRAVVAFTSVWCSEASALADDLRARHAALAASGTQVLLVIGDGGHHGQASDGLGVLTFARAHRAPYAVAMEEHGALGSPCEVVALVERTDAGLRVADVRTGAGALASVLED